MISFIATGKTNIKILQYEDLLKTMKEKIQNSSNGQAEHSRIDKIKLNYQRYLRISKTYQVSEELQVLIKSVSSSQDWFILSEDWCGDSGQILPYLEKFSHINPLIRLILVPRDKNPEIMDHYLTDGKRAIPKLIAVNDEGEELFVWGPRPREAQGIFERNLQAGLSKPQAMERLHHWYSKNQGKAIESEFAKIFKKMK